MKYPNHKNPVTGQPGLLESWSSKPIAIGVKLLALAGNAVDAITTQNKNIETPIESNAKKSTPELAKQPRQQGTKPTKARPSGGKTIARAISKFLFNRLVKYLMERRELPLVKETLLWVNSGVYTGLRPNEWSDAQIIRSIDPVTKKLIGVFLKVPNGKPVKKSSPPDCRTLDISNLTDQMVKECQQVIDFTKKWIENGSYIKNMLKCNKILLEAGKSLEIPRRIKITLGTMRHLFVNNFPGTNEELATTLGHKSLATNKASYGKKGTKWSKKDCFPVVKAVLGDVTKNQVFLNRRSKKNNT